MDLIPSSNEYIRSLGGTGSLRFRFRYDPHTCTVSFIPIARPQGRNGRLALALPPGRGRRSATKPANSGAPRRMRNSGPRSCGIVTSTTQNSGKRFGAPPGGRLAEETVTGKDAPKTRLLSLVQELAHG